MSSGAACAESDKPVSLRITVPTTTLRLQETVQLNIQARFPDGSTQDVTGSSRTRYVSDDRRTALIDKSGLIRALSTQGRAQARVDIMSFRGDLGVGVRLTVVQQQVSIPRLPPRPEEPIGLEITVPKTTMREGETLQLSVIAVFADGSTKDVTSTSHGTNYQRDFRKVTVDDNGLVTVLSPEGLAVDSARIWLVHKSFAGMIKLTILKGGPVVERDNLEVTSSKTTLRAGEMVQLAVLQKLADGSTLDLTDPNTGTTYASTDERMLVPEPDGRITCIWPYRVSEEYAVIVVRNGNRQGWIKFKILPGGPGPSLDVAADKTVLREGEQTQLHVYKPLPDGGRRDVTDTATGTRYLTFVTSGTYDPTLSRVPINDKGLARAPVSIWPIPRFSVIVFVRHGGAVGWVKLNVLRKDG